MIDHMDRGETQKTGGLEGRVQIPILWRGELDLEADYRMERWSGNNREINDFDVLGAELSLFWRFRAFTVGVEGRIFRTEWRKQGDEVRNRWLVRVRRDL
jgi:hypothetical protein